MSLLGSVKQRSKEAFEIYNTFNNQHSKLLRFCIVIIDSILSHSSLRENLSW